MVLGIVSVTVARDDRDGPAVIRADLLGREPLDLGNELGVRGVEIREDLDSGPRARALRHLGVERVGRDPAGRELAGLAQA